MDQMTVPPWAMTDEEILADSEYTFPVAEDLSYYGPDATEGDVNDYERFASDYLFMKCERRVDTYRVEHYNVNLEPVGMNDLRNRVWDAFCNSH